MTTRDRNRELTKEGADFLISAFEEVDFMSVECDVCGKKVGDHSSEEVKICNDKLAEANRG